MKKYRKGEQIKTISELLHIIFDRHESVYFGNRVFGAAFISNWQIGTVIGGLRHGRFCRAEPTSRSQR